MNAKIDDIHLLKDSAELIRMSQNLAGLGHWVLHLPDLDLECSEIATDILGITSSNRLKINDLLPLFKQDSIRIIQSYLGEESYKECKSELQLITSQQVEKHILCHCAPIRNINDEVVCIVGSVQDITERKATENELVSLLQNQQQLNEKLLQREQELVAKEEALKQSLEELNAIHEELVDANKFISDRERHVSAIFDNTPDIIVSVDKNLVITKANQTFKDIFRQYTGGNFEGKLSVMDVIVPEKRNDYAALYKRVLNGEYVYQITHNDEEYYGKYISEEFYSPIKDENGTIDGFAIFIRDITERIGAENKVKTQEMINQSIINSTDDFIASVDLDFIFTGANTNAREFLKIRTGNELIIGETNFLEAINPYMRKRYEMIFKKVLEGDTVKEVVHRAAIEGKSREYYTEEYCNPIRDENNTIKGISIFAKDITQRVLTEEKLALREIQFSAIINSTDDYILSLDEHLNIAAYNKPYFERVSQVYDKPIIPGKTSAFDLLPPKLHNDYIEIFKKVLRGEKVSKNFLRQYDVSGIDDLHTEELFNPILDESNKIKGIAIFVRDVTHKIMAASKLRENDLKFSYIIDSTSDFIVSLDEHLVVTSANMSYTQRIKEVTGVILQPGLTHANEILPPYLQNSYREIFDAVLNGEKRVEYFTRKYESDTGWPETVYSEEFFNPIYNEKGKITGIAIFARDITQKRLVEDRMRESEQILKMAQKIAKLGSWVYDLRSHEVIWSDQMYEIYEVSPDHMDTDIYESLLSPPDYELNRTKVQQLIQTKEPFTLEYVIETKSKQKKHILSIGTPILDENGEVARISGSAQDITAIREAEEKLKRQTSELIESNRKMAEYKLMALRSVMNPHFLFNSLNSIQYFIAKNEREHALNYLSLFSKLIRSILSSSIENYNSLREEIEILKLYINLETLRFDNKFTTIYEIDEDLDIDLIDVPSLILQPYVENAILHGLYNKGSKDGMLRLTFAKKKNTLECVIEDNGVGRKEAQQIRQAGQLHKSLGMLVTQERLELANKDNNLSVKIEDLYSKGKPSGTRVTVLITI